MKLTAIIIVSSDSDKNQLRKARGSIWFADEVIVVREKFPVSDFSKVRNRALERAKGEWVLFVDSDEIISKDLSLEIKSQISELKTQNQNSNFKTNGVAGFYIKRKDCFLGRWLEHGETANIRLLRLAKKNAGRWTRPVHEVWKINGKLGELKNPLLHYSHETVEGMVEKLDRYSGIEAEYRNKKQVNRLTGYQVITEMILFPVGKFIQNYIFRLGFLDGMEGFIHAGMMSGHSFLVRGKQLMR